MSIFIRGEKTLKASTGIYFFLVLVFYELPSLADLFDKNMPEVITLNEYIFLDEKIKIKCIYLRYLFF